MARGITSSSMAANDHTGAVCTGCASASAPTPAASNRPDRATARAPTSKAPITGGRRRPQSARADSSKKAATMGAAMAASLCKARTMSRPKRKKTPATMPITMGMGSAAITRLTQPLSPSTKIRALVA